MKIIVYGAGAIGAYFGGRFAEAGADVTFFVRERRAAQLANGLVIESPEGNVQADVHIATTVDDVTEADVIIVAIKGYHFDAALPQIVELANKTNAYVLPLLNGIEHISVLQQALNEQRVLGGFASIIATLNEQGHVIHSSKGSSIQIGALTAEQQPIVDELAAIGERMHTAVIQQPAILKGMWKKYMLITAFAGITSATQQPASAMQHAATLQVATTMLREVAQLAQLEGVAIPHEEIEKEIERLANFKGTATSSMHQDMRKGLPLEVEHLHGGALRVAKKHGITIPTIATIYGILQPYANGAIENE